MNRKRDLPEIKESADELRGLMRTAADKPTYQRLHCLWLVASGQADNKAELARRLGVRRATVRAWLGAYAGGGLGGLTPKRPGTSRRSVLEHHGREPGSLLAEIEKLLSDPEQCPQGWKQLWQLLRDGHGLDMGYHAFYQAARKRFPGARVKAARPRHVKKDPQAEAGFKKN
jgi:transposase